MISLFKQLFLTGHCRKEVPITSHPGSVTSLLIMGSLVLWLGCSKSNSSAPSDVKSSASGGGSPQITASPNPVPAGSEKFGKTTITWSTGDGSVGEVYVSTNGDAERLFAGNRPKGSLEAAWIGKGEYEFKLYAGKEHKTVLGSVKVTRAAGN